MPDEKKPSDKVPNRVPSDTHTTTAPSDSGGTTTGAAVESEVVYTQPTTVVDLESRLALVTESPEDRDKRVAKEFEEARKSPFSVTDKELTEAEDDFIGTDPIYNNYSDVTHKPFTATEGPEAEATKRAVEAMAERDENSRQASGGYTTYGPATELDPVDRHEGVTRGGPGAPAEVPPPAKS